MERPLWDRIQEIYHSTLPMDRSERSVFVARVCNHDPFLLREVNSLLDADDSSAGFLETPVFEIGLKIISDQTGKDSDGAAPVQDLVGTTIGGRYLIERELGHGGMGKVYLARDLTLHSRPVVIKILLQASLQNAYVMKKFRQEVEALARIDHPGVVSVLGAGELPDGKPYIVMQYVSGVTLRSQIPSEGMNLERAASILKQIGAALEDVHERGIFHRDLKPENIMLQVLRNGDELAKVVDFGIAKVKDSVVAPSTVDSLPVGTLLYMSPEQLRGGDKITAASDIYSMAVIAYEMVTGRRPFNPVSGPQLLELHREGVRVKPIDLRSSLSTEAQAIILRALSFDPADRYQSATEFGDSLARALMNDRETLSKYLDLGVPATAPRTNPLPEPPSTKSTNHPERPFRLGKNRLVVVGALLIVLACVAVLSGVYLYSFREGPANSNPGPSRSFTYSLMVQRMREEVPYQEPYVSNGQEVFETGYKFKLNVSSPEPGYLYVFNEGPPQPNDTSFTIIYPTPLTNNGSASLGSNQSFQTNWNTFSGQPGTENFWIVWSTSPVSELESAKAEAFLHPHGGLTGATLEAVKGFLVPRKSEVQIRRYKNPQRTTVRGTGDILVTLAEFEHR